MRTHEYEETQMRYQLKNTTKLMCPCGVSIKTLQYLACKRNRLTSVENKKTDSEFFCIDLFEETTYEASVLGMIFQQCWCG